MLNNAIQIASFMFRYFVVPFSFCLFALGLGAESVTVYILDSGIRTDHEVFEGLEIETVDFVGNRKAPDAKTATLKSSKARKENFGEHATMMAGLVVEQAPDVQLVSVRTLDKKGKGKWSEFLKGVHWISNHHQEGQAAVANLSLGGMPEPRIEEMVSKAIDDLVAGGVTVVVAAGNEGEDVPNRIPSTMDSVISVGAVSLFNFRLSDSNYGSCVDIYAPGENLKGPGSSSPKKRIRKSGTSAAAAAVTGHVAAYLKEHPQATPADVKQWLIQSSEPGKVKNLPKGHVEETLLFKQ